MGDFPSEVQVAFLLYSYMTDSYEGMSGTYMGKDWGNFEFLLELHEIDNKMDIFYFCKLIELSMVKYQSEQSDAKQKAEERRAKNSAGPGQTYTHNVQG